MTLDWMDHVIIQALDLIKLSLLPVIVWLFRNRIRRWFKGNDKEKKRKFKPQGMGF